MPYTRSAQASAETFSVLCLQGQTRKVVVRVVIMGSAFEIDDFNLDGSQVSIRELPLTIPAPLNHPIPRDARKKIRHELLHSSVRILIKTVFIQSSRTFNTYFSSTISIRNNLPTPVLVRSLSKGILLIHMLFSRTTFPLPNPIRQSVCK